MQGELNLPGWKKEARMFPIAVLLSATTTFLLLGVAFSSPPGDTVRCVAGTHGCTVTNSLGVFPDRTTCKAAEVSYPTSEEGLIELVAMAAKHKRKMKVVTRYSHSIPKLACPDGDEGLLISTNHLNNIVSTDVLARTMTVQSGVTLEQLIKEAAKVGLALPYAPYWWGVTIGGLLSTGAHGSSLWDKGGAVHEYVIELRLVSPGTRSDGYVKVTTLNSTRDEDLNAAKVSLGVLGVVSQVTLQLQPMFKRSISYETMKDDDLADRAVDFGNQHEFADITWYPSLQQVVYRIDDRVSSNVPGDGVYDYFGFRAIPTVAITAKRTSEENQELMGNYDGKCIDGQLSATAIGSVAYGLTNNGLIFTGYPVVGYENNLQSSGSCLNSKEDFMATACPWDPRVFKTTFYHQTTFTIALSKVKDFIEDIRTLIFLSPQSLCGLELYNGILMRYVKASTAYLGKDEDSMDFDITYYRSKDPMTPRLYEDILEEVEQMGLFKYGGLPHWGKNRNLAFDGVQKKYLNATMFLSAKKRYDPMGLFSSEWTDQVLGLRGGVTVDREGCALEGLCVCSEDIHCAPIKGYFCRPGKVYKEARVCAFEMNSL